MNDKIYVGFNSDQLNLIHEILEYELERDKEFEEENKDYHDLIKETIKTILKEV